MIKHDGKTAKDGWYLDYIEIYSFKTEKSYMFECNQWISTHRPPNNSNSIVLKLFNNIYDSEKLKNQTGSRLNFRS